MYHRGMVHVRASGSLGVCVWVVACTGAPEPAKQGAAEQAVPAKAAPPEHTDVEPMWPLPVDPNAAPPVVPEPYSRRLDDKFMFVFRGEVAVVTHPEATWESGKVKFKKTKEGLEGRRDVDMTKLPEPLRKLEGAGVTLYGPRGRVCEATLKGWSLYGLSERGDEEEREEVNELPSLPVLMAGLADAKGSCAGALWARRSDLPAPAVFVPDRPDAGLLAKARAATEKLTMYATMTSMYEEYAREAGDKLSWPKFAAKQFRATKWTAEGGRTLVSVEIGDPENVRCEANFSEFLAAVFAVENGELRVLTERGAWQPVALLDVTGDETPEVLLAPPGGIGGMLSGLEWKPEAALIDELRFPSEGLGCGGDGMEDEP